MFQALELGRRVRKKDYAAEEPRLRMRLLELQRALRAAEVPVLVIVSGVEGAGKSEVVNRLHEWLDPRGVRASAYWKETDEERLRPRFWRFWREMPPRGTIGVMFGSWYTRPIVDRAFGRTKDDVFDRELGLIASHERMLNEDGLVLIKLWCHLSQDAQRERLEAEEAAHAKAEKRRRAGKKPKKGKGWRLSPLVRRFAKRYPELARASERAIRRTDLGHAPWTLIEAEDRRYRDLTVARALVERFEQALEQPARLPRRPATARAEGAADGAVVSDVVAAPERDGPTILDMVDLAQTVAPENYSRRLAAAQRRLNELAWRAHDEEVPVVAVFEGWDAAGKGGAIRRVTAALDARLYRVVPIAAPTDEERAQHYLWRFWRHLPRDGDFRIYDRSWYGRVLVERVEGFATPDEWSRAYAEINAFEDQLVRHGVVLLKFWLHISPEEQLRRFEARAETPWKAHKITAEDWRNRARLGDYRAAVNEMVARTSTADAPWDLVPAEDKRVARLAVISAFTRRLKRALG